MSLIVRVPTTTNNNTNDTNNNSHSVRTGVGGAALYLGGKNDAKNRDRLVALGITHIINVTPPKDVHVQSGVPNYFERDQRFVYMRIAVYDDPSGVTALRAAIPNVQRFIAAALCRGQNVLVHCQRGISRSTTVVLLYLIGRLEMRLDDALALIQRRRPQAQPNPAFWNLLLEYESEVASRLSTSRPNGMSSLREETTPVASPATTTKPRPRVMGPALPPTNQGTTYLDESEVTAVSQQESVTLDTRVCAGNKLHTHSIGPSLPPTIPTSDSVDRSIATTASSQQELSWQDDDDGDLRPNNLLLCPPQQPKNKKARIVGPLGWSSSSSSPPPAASSTSTIQSPPPPP